MHRLLGQLKYLPLLLYNCHLFRIWLWNHDFPILPVTTVDGQKISDGKIGSDSVSWSSDPAIRRLTSLLLVSETKSKFQKFGDHDITNGICMEISLNALSQTYNHHYYRDTRIYCLISARHRHHTRDHHQLSRLASPFNVLVCTLLPLHHDHQFSTPQTSTE